MRVKRHKDARRIMNYFHMNFNFFPPYRVILDPEYIRHALLMQMPIKESIETYLETEVAPMVTRCSYAELRRLGESDVAAAAKQFKFWHCTHDKDNPLPAADCIRDVLSQNISAIACMQDVPLRNAVRRLPAVPILYMNHSVLVLEKPSEASVRAARERAFALQLPKDWELAAGAAADGEQKKKKKKKRKGGPNPLSCLPKKKKPKKPATPKETSASPDDRTAADAGPTPDPGSGAAAPSGVAGASPSAAAAAHAAPAADSARPRKRKAEAAGAENAPATADAAAAAAAAGTVDAGAVALGARQASASEAPVRPPAKKRRPRHRRKSAGPELAAAAAPS